MLKNLRLNKFDGALSHLAFDSNKSTGRVFKENVLNSYYQEANNPFKVDVERLKKSMSFSRLENKTKTFSVNHFGNVRNKKTHTEEVFKISTSIALSLGLNKNLTQAIALSHDIGCVPFGRLGEELFLKINGTVFPRTKMSVLIAQELELLGKGLNLSHEVIQGIFDCSNNNTKYSLVESQVVVLSNEICSTFDDLSDAFKLGLVKKDKNLVRILSFLGDNQRERRFNIIHSLIEESARKGAISFVDSDESFYFYSLKKWLEENLYTRNKFEIFWEKEKNLFYKSFDILLNNEYFKDLDITILLSILNDKELKTLKFLDNEIFFDKKSFLSKTLNVLREKNIN